MLPILLIVLSVSSSLALVVHPPAEIEAIVKGQYIKLKDCIYIVPDSTDIWQSLQNTSDMTTNRDLSGKDNIYPGSFEIKEEYEKICKLVTIETVNTDFDDEYPESTVAGTNAECEKCSNYCRRGKFGEADGGGKRSDEGTIAAERLEDCSTSQLLTAVASANVILVQKLLKEGAKIGEKDCNGLTAIDIAIQNKNHYLLIAFAPYIGSLQYVHAAVIKGNDQTLETLLALGNHVDAVNKEGKSPLQEALLSNNSDAVHILLRYGADINYKTPNGNTCVHLLSENGNSRGLALLKKLGLLNSKLINDENNQGETAILKAVRGNFPKVVNILVKSGGDISKKSNGQTYLHIAVTSRSVEALGALLRHCVPADVDDKDGLTPVILAVRNDDVKSIELLASSGADIRQKYGNDSSALSHQAAKYGSVNALQWLMKYGLSIAERDSDSWTALHSAAWNGQTLAAFFLLDSSAEVDPRDKDAWTPLHMAARNGHLPLVRLLIDRGALIEAKEKDGWMPIHLAASKGHVSVIEELLSHKMDINAVTRDWRTPLHLAAQYEHSRLAKILLDKGADPNRTDLDGKTPKDYATDKDIMCTFTPKGKFKPHLRGFKPCV